MKKIDHKEKEGRVWLVLDGPLLKWYKDSKKLEMDLKGSIELEYVNVSADIEHNDRFYVASSLPKVPPMLLFDFDQLYPRTLSLTLTPYPSPSTQP